MEGRTGLVLSQDSETDGPRQPGRIASARAGLFSFLAVPLISLGEVRGTLNFESAQANTYTSEHLDLATQVAARTAGATASARAHAAL
ncbi:MAG: GAF domain-containing protein [SAR202 cluster bacterium]|nr:GAF domain-containing protein [SAR202 cluster bacterium]